MKELRTNKHPCPTIESSNCQRFDPELQRVGLGAATCLSSTAVRQDGIDRRSNARTHARTHPRTRKRTSVLVHLFSICHWAMNPSWVQSDAPTCVADSNVRSPFGRGDSLAAARRAPSSPDPCRHTDGLETDLGVAAGETPPVRLPTGWDGVGPEFGCLLAEDRSSGCAGRSDPLVRS